MWWFYGPSLLLVSRLIFGCALIVLFAIDLEHQILPDVITLPGIVVGLLCAATVLPLALSDSILGLVVGGGLLWSVALVSPYLFGKEGMGGGDIKLLAMIGAFLGWQQVLLTVLVGGLLGSVIGVGLIVARVIRRSDYIPFGPFLSFGAVVAMLFGPEILRWYGEFLTGRR
jgi:leader peptidase (prepilin peptidase)/N-methyltransferase